MISEVSPTEMEGSGTVLLVEEEPYQSEGRSRKEGKGGQSTKTAGETRPRRKEGEKV